MKAIVCTKYGSPDVLQLQEVAKPTPLDDEAVNPKTRYSPFGDQSPVEKEPTGTIGSTTMRGIETALVGIGTGVGGGARYLLCDIASASFSSHSKLSSGTFPAVAYTRTLKYGELQCSR
jgi:hypothetical protein